MIDDIIIVMDKKRVLMTYIESGMGHITSINSISDNFKKYYGDKFDVVESYIMKEDGDKDLISWEKFIIKQTKNTNKIKGYGSFIFWFLRVMGGLKFMRFLHRTVFAKHTRHCLEAFKKRNPDVIVSTHYFLTFAALEYRRKINPNCRVVTYNPDNNVHLWWDNREHLFLVNNDSAYFEAVGKRKFNPSQVKKVSFIAREQILEANFSREEYRKKLNLPENKFCVIVADGVYACGKANKITKALLKITSPITIVLVAGKNEKLLKKYNKMLEKGKINKKVSFVVLPFTKNIYEYYKAADVFVTKAGPNAILDSVFMGTPVVVDMYAHPIEKATKELFIDKLQMGKAIYKPKKVREQIENWIKDDKELRQFEENTKQIDKFHCGGEESARLIYEYATKEPVTKFSDYENSLYELARDSKFDELTTPFNVYSKKDEINYDKILKNSFFKAVLRGIVKSIVFVLGPVVNFFGFGLKIEGKKNLKNLKSAIVVSNHVHYLDSLWNFQVLRGKRVYITAAPHNFKKGFGGEILKAGGMIPYPTTYSQNKEFLKSMKTLLSKPAMVQICPEQSLWLRYEQSRPLKKSAFLIAQENDVPIVPVVYVFKKKKLRHKKAVKAIVGEAIYPNKELSKPEAIQELQAKTQQFYDKTIVDFYGYKNYDMRKINKN